MENSREVGRYIRKVLSNLLEIKIWLILLQVWLLPLETLLFQKQAYLK